ncbi:NAD(P)/FAD-dependent oxidoreductase [bacterium CPR1]|nr:NAD(P)/FAD-dependent oxidoreductase [bacterium CPR1]
MSRRWDAIVVGSGPNGLAAAIELARHQRSVLVLEAAAEPGGGMRTAELTLPGFKHDVCASIHPTGLASPFFKRLPLDVEWVHPDVPLAHPLDGGRAVIMERSVSRTAERLGRDGRAYQSLMAPFVAGWDRIDNEALGPIKIFPRAPFLMLRLAFFGLRSARSLVGRFRGQEAPALLAGLAGHSVLPMEWAPGSAAALALGTLAHRVGWPMLRGGTGVLARALAGVLHQLGGELRCNHPVRSLGELPEARIKLLDVTPRQFVAMAGNDLPSSWKDRLLSFRYGPGVVKVDYALSAPVPWTNAEVARAATVHLGGTFEEIARSERACWEGRHAERPYVLCVQNSLFDPTRAPAGKHTLWAYCHVPQASPLDVSASIDDQIERFAPGFRELVLARSVLTPDRLQSYNANYVGGDITGGALTLGQLFTRPVVQLDPYRTPLPGVFLCSSSTPPGGGVHGMCGYHAARSALAGW